MSISSAIFFIFIAVALAGDCPSKKTSSKLICYYGKLTDVNSCKCTHVVLPADSDVKAIDRARENLKGVKILITVNEFNQGLVNILKSSKVDGIEISLKKLDSKNDINDFISTIKNKFGNDLYVVLSVPARAETLAKYFDFKTLSKNADLFVLQTAFLGASKNVTFHPSRLSGLWDMQNTDSVVDLVSGLGAPLSKLVITSPVQAFKFQLQSEKHTAPGSPALEIRSIDRDELCRTMKDGGNWTLERDQDQAGPYIFSKDQWIAFEDATSIDIKAKYARVRGLAGMAFKDMSQDGGTKCESSILEAAYNGLSRQARAPRGAVLHSLEREILETPARPLDTIQVSPYRITRVIDVEGNVHVVRQDTRTEFECSRQGYFVHPRSCGRFYRCVKFDQYSDEFSVFEFDCPAGLAFDSRYEVCVWPGSLPHASPCSGSSEIAPVPRERFVCPNQQGYFADPENCRWFFACLDHGKSPLTAYEFRCPFGLVFDESRLLCEWPWLVPKCGNGYAVGSQIVYGGTGLVALDQYDGLGVLGATALGGLHGPLQQPVAKVYSNVGAVGVVSQGVGIGGVALTHGQGFTAGAGGLSAKATQSLQNAGLHNLDYSQDSSAHGASGLAYTAGSESTGNVGTFGLRLGQSTGSGLLFTHGQDTSQAVAHQNIGSGTAIHQNSGLLYTHGQDSSQAIAHQNIGSGTVIHQNAGLLYTHGQDTSQAVSHQNIGSGATIHQNSGFYYTQGQDNSQNVVHEGNGFGATSQQSFLHGQHANTVHANSGLGFATHTDSASINAGVYQGSDASDIRTNQFGQGFNLNYYVGSSGAASVDTKSGEGFGANVHLVDGATTGTVVTGTAQETSVSGSGNAHLINGLVYDAGFGAKSQQNSVQYHGVGSGVAVSSEAGVSTGASLSSESSGAVLSTGAAGTEEAVAHDTAGISGYDASKSTVEYHGNSGTTYGAGISGKINIVGAGYSAVGVANSGIEVTNLGDHSNTVSHVTPSPISVTTVSSIPAVTSVPVPALKVASGFQSYKGGVVANVPELQFRVHKPIDNVYYQEGLAASRGSSGIANISTSYVNVISSTPSTLAVDGGYHYPKPTVAFVEEPVKTTAYQQSNVAASITTYQKPLFVSTTAVPLVENVQPLITAYQKPVVVSTTAIPLVEKVKIRPVITTYQKPGSTTSYVQHHVQKVQPVVTTYQQPIVSTTQTPLIVNKVEPAVVSTYNVQNEGASFVGYDYPKPAVEFEETPVKTVGGSFSYQNLDAIHKTQGYTYSKPTVAFEEVPLNTVNQAAVSTYSYSAPSTAKPLTFVQQVQPAVPVQPVVKEQGAFSYSSFQKHHSQQNYDQNGKIEVSSYNVPSSTIRPITLVEQVQPVVQVQPTEQTIVQPAVKQGAFSYSSFQKHDARQNYDQNAQIELTSYNVPSSTIQPVVQVQPTVQTVVQPAVKQGAFSYSSFQKHNAQQNYDQKSQIQITSYNVPSSTVTPIIEQSPQVYVSSTPATVVQQKVVQPAVVSSYSFSGTDEGYYYPKPSIAFEEKQSVVTYQQPAIQKTEINQQIPTYYQSPVIPVKGLTSYKFKNIIQSIVNKGYSYAQPTITYQEKPAQNVQQPAVVSSYSYTAPSTVKPAVLLEQQPVLTYTPSSTPKPQVVVPKQPSVVSSYSFTASTTARPSVEKEVEFTGYDYPKPAVPFVEQPVPAVTYENRQPIEEVPFVKKTAYVTGNTATSYQQYNNAAAVQYEQKPLVVENYQAPVVSSTPQYEYQEAVVSSTPQYEFKQQYSSVDSGYVYEKPAIQFEEKPHLVQNYQIPVVSSTPRPIIDYSYVQSTPKPTFSSTISSVIAAKRPIEQQPFRFYDSRLTPTARPVVYSTSVPVVQTVTTSKPIAKYSFSSFDDQYQSVSVPVAPVEISTPSHEYLPVSTTSAPSEAHVVSGAVAPISNYGLKVTTEAPIEISTPTHEYLPARARVRVTTSAPEVTTPSREYLPVRTRVKVTTPAYSSTDDLVSTSRPVNFARISSPKTIIKVNDFYPLLPAKLGAQCTCVSNSVRLRKKPLRIVVDDDDDDGYVVDDNNNGVVVENYEYNPQKVVDITPTPEIYIKSTTAAIEPSSTVVYPVRKRVRVRPVTSTVIYDAPVTQAAEIFLKKTVTPAVTFVTTESPIGRGAGFNLVEQTAAKESAQSKNFDRYGPGGWRSRNEKLQETIDCQRPGLFRHPTQCNKFYSCRWDCTKNRYTLYVFNCPVHLTFDNSLGACNWPSQGPACLENTLLPSD